MMVGGVEEGKQNPGFMLYECVIVRALSWTLYIPTRILIRSMFALRTSS